MDSDQLIAIETFLLIHKMQGADAAVAWAEKQSRELDGEAEDKPTLSLVPSD